MEDNRTFSKNRFSDLCTSMADSLHGRHGHESLALAHILRVLSGITDAGILSYVMSSLTVFGGMAADILKLTAENMKAEADREEAEIDEWPDMITLGDDIEH